MTDKRTIDQTEKRIEQGMDVVVANHKTASKAGQQKLEQGISCVNLVDSIQSLVNDLVRYDQMVDPGSPLMGKAVKTLEAHEPPAACKGIKPTPGPRVTS